MSVTKKNSNNKDFLSQKNHDLNKMHSSVDIHRDLQDTHKLQMTAREERPAVSGNSLNPISKIHQKFLLGTATSSRLRLNEQQSSTRFVIKNMSNSPQKYFSALTRKNDHEV